MKRLAVVSPGYLWFPCESGFPRVFDLCMDMVNAGYEVDVYISDFQHHTKKRREINLIKSQNYPVNVIDVHTIAYKKNVSIRRILSNNILAKNLKKALESRIDQYDAVFVSIPPNDVASSVVEVCTRAGVPCIADVEDLWPEAMAMVLKRDGLREMLLRQFTEDAEYVYANCNAVVGTSGDYTERAMKMGRRDIPYKTAYVGVKLDKFDEGYAKNKERVVKSNGEFWITYAGSIGTSYDIGTLVRAGEILENTDHEKIRIKLLGTGPKIPEITEYIKKRGIHCVDIMGFVEYERMTAFLKHSDVLVNSFIKGAPQSIVNKVGDYLAAGRPIINTLENPVFCKIIEDNNVGVNIEPGNPGALCNAILMYYNDRDKITEQGNRARSLCETEFDRSVSNKKIIQVIDSLIKE